MQKDNDMCSCVSLCAERFSDSSRKAIITFFTIENTPSMRLNYGAYRGMESGAIPIESGEARTHSAS